MVRVWTKKGASLDNEKVQDWVTFLERKKGASLGKKGASLETSRILCLTWVVYNALHGQDIMLSMGRILCFMWV